MSEQSKDRPMVIYHGGNCMDGWTSAWVAHLKLGDNADYLPANYGDPAPDDAALAGRLVFILDFSYPRDVLLRMAQAANRVVVLDHHKTAQKNLDNLAAPGLAITFDMERSGAALAWLHFFPEMPASPLVNFVEDRDLWKWQLPHSREVSAALASLPKTFDIWDDIDRDMRTELGISLLVREGHAILRYQEQVIENAAKSAFWARIDGQKVPCVNCTNLISETVGKLAQGHPFAAGFFQKETGEYVFSLRSEESGWDVSLVAQVYGGGGHAHAAGFTVPAGHILWGGDAHMHVWHPKQHAR